MRTWIALAIASLLLIGCNNEKKNSKQGDSGAGTAPQPQGSERGRSDRIVSASRMKVLLLGMAMYEAENRGLFPDSLEVLYPKYVEKKEPRDAGYIYNKPAASVPKLKNTAQTVVLYEKFDRWPGGINVGFADGHVEWIADEAKFKELLANSKPQ